MSETKISCFGHRFIVQKLSEVNLTVLDIDQLSFGFEISQVCCSQVVNSSKIFLRTYVALF